MNETLNSRAREMAEAGRIGGATPPVTWVTESLTADSTLVALAGRVEELRSECAEALEGVVRMRAGYEALSMTDEGRHDEERWSHHLAAYDALVEAWAVHSRADEAYFDAEDLLGAEAYLRYGSDYGEQLRAARRVAQSR